MLMRRNLEVMNAHREYILGELSRCSLRRLSADRYAREPVEVASAALLCRHPLR
jgi:hypothetical protein